jgi:hypothetical protein
MVIADPFEVGALKQQPIRPKLTRGQEQKNPVWMSKQGWAMAKNGVVGLIDGNNFELDLNDDAVCFTGYDPINKEFLGSVEQ